MIKFIFNFKARKLQAITYKLNRGMTYVELIVVLSIFSVMTSVVLFNYGEFQAKIDIKNLASDIALKIVEAQKSALSGKLPPSVQSLLLVSPSTWKPSYGVYFNHNNDSNSNKDNKSFLYFVDLDNDKKFIDYDCAGVGECLDKIIITKGNTISSIFYYLSGDITGTPLDDLTITFARPDSGARLFYGTAGGVELSGISYVQINITSPQGASSNIKLYASGRIQVN